MAKPREWTLQGLADEFQVSREKMGKMLAGLKSRRVEFHGQREHHYFIMKDVIEHIMTEGAGKLNPQQEAARLNKERRIKVELENAELRGELCRTDDVRKMWFNIITNAKTKLRGLPHKLVHRILAASELKEGLVIMEQGIAEVLDELSGDGVPERKARTESSGNEGVEAATKPDRKPVGRRKTKTKS